MNRHSRIFVAGHGGLVGSAICRHLTRKGFSNLILRTRAELDLRDQQAVEQFFQEDRPEYVFMGAAKVGGIVANSSCPAESIYDNLAVQTNVMHSAWKHETKKLLFLGSSCVYPKLAPQPLREGYLLTSALEPSNEWYAIARIAGLKMAEAYRRQYGFNAISAMPTNLYGPGDRFDLNNSHVLPAQLRKFFEARAQNVPEVVVWGTGTPRREFLHVDDLAGAALFLMDNYDVAQIINVGTGSDVTIRELAEMLKKVTGYDGSLIFDHSRPDGTPQKLLDISKIKSLGWTPSISLEQGIESTFQWYSEHQTSPKSQNSHSPEPRCIEITTAATRTDNRINSQIHCEAAPACFLHQLSDECLRFASADAPPSTNRLRQPSSRPTDTPNSPQISCVVPPFSKRITAAVFCAVVKRPPFFSTASGSTTILIIRENAYQYVRTTVLQPFTFFLLFLLTYLENAHSITK